ncbi:MAG: hypothetical protein WBB85_00175 [Albidovulum sp.]|uniref:hypothetical protein n=1 Tax=Albidovulum sp. TaxID=1872424 RepID=UPI003CC31A76
MPTTRPEIGAVWHYPYLWKWQAETGETEGRKPRPTLLSAVVPIAGDTTRLYLLPITGSEPTADRDALEVPITEIRRAELSEYKRLWIIFDEHNRDTLEESFYFEPTAQIGTFSKAFVKVIARRFMTAYQTQGARSGVDRTD